MSIKQLAICILTSLGFITPLFSYNLIDSKADARTVAVFNYLQSVYGKKMLSGCWTETQYGGAQAFHDCTGEWPAIWGQDMNSWHSDRNGPYWNNVWAENIAGFKTAWARGQIPQVNWHWQGPQYLNNGVYAPAPKGGGMGAWSSLTDQQWSDIVTPGTALYNTMIEDLDYHVTGFLKKIVDAKGPLPILFRPLHEIDGGWFWWTCKSDPAKTAQLFKILQDRIMNHHQMHNLIWIYNPGVLCDGGSWPPYETSEYNRRRAFYPGDAYCDMTGIDLYQWDWINAGTYGTGGKTYRDAWNVMKAISSTKMIGLSEAEGFPDPTKCFTDPTFAPWLYALPWYSNSSNGVPCNVLNARVNNPYMINASDLPDFNGNIPTPTIASISANVTSGTTPLAVTFDGSGSNGTALAYSWNFGDGATSTIQKPQHTFTTAGSFKVKLTVSSGTTTNSDSITITATTPGVEPAVRTINDATTGTGVNQFDFSGTWGTAVSTAYNNDEHWSVTTGASYTVRFYGAQVLLYGTKDAHHGIATVSIDGGTPVDVDFYSATRTVIAQLYTSPALTKGSHSMVVTLSGRKNAASTGTVIVGDRVDILQSAGTTSLASYRGSAGSGLSSDIQWRNLRIPSLGSITLTITNAAGATMGTYDRASLTAGLRKVENLPKGIYFVTIASASAKSITTQRVAKTFSVR